ncbi:uncharacterized protein N7529_002851 [Penicillium soppii]|uniref:uncharacterized protein n=1 Tax=Penicillium soppii TaxID=69789 RepID=UPI0025467CCB|nr:uncharacterized protein N7529_002851 [Penicillium soppii]KAJ5874421.1 hypothetical protein N7529_002851 [Penicillium soppii]
MAPTISEAPAELSQSDQQTTQQEHDLEYYRRFLKDLISSIQDGDTAAVDRIVSLIRSGASNQDIHQAVQPVRNL